MTNTTKNTTGNVLLAIAGLCVVIGYRLDSSLLFLAATACVITYACVLYGQEGVRQIKKIVNSIKRKR
jgi:hypothetical protein